MNQSISDIIAQVKKELAADNVKAALSEVRRAAMTPLKILDYQKINCLIDGYRETLLKHFNNEPLRIALLGGYTTQPIAEALRTSLLVEGYIVEIYESEYNSFKMEVLQPDSNFYCFQPHFVIFATGSMNIETFPSVDSSLDDIRTLLSSFLKEYQTLWTTAKERTGAVIIQHNFEPPEENSLGRLDGKYPWSRSRYIQSINEGLWEKDGKGVHILDVHSLSIRLGVYKWYDPRWYHHSKHGFNPSLAFEYGRMVTGLFRALQRKAKKCLVVDLDNTLWGGIVGDDGLHGIHIGNISAQGEAYGAFCRYLKRLKDRGVILAVNSKNEPDIAKEVFTSHPEMPLKLEDISAFYANWQSKSENLIAIVKDLNIGLDSLVFIDDNPVECAEVREMLPDVTVIEMKGDPAYYIRQVDQMHLFDQLDITQEDLTRSQSYKVQGKIRETQLSSSNLDEFLENLNMVGEVYVSTKDDVPRLEQMFKKINQFNLTLRSYEQTSIMQFIENEYQFCLSCWLKDKHTTYGLVSAVVGHINREELQIDNWVMSCRVFSRTFEQFIFNKIMRFAQECNCSYIIGEYIPTARNGYIKDLLSKLDFKVKSKGQGIRGILDLSDGQVRKSFVQEAFAKSD